MSGEPTKASEIVKKATMLVTCKSGNIYKIRKMPLPTIARFFSAIDINITDKVEVMTTSISEQLSDPMKMEKFMIAISDMLPICVSEPKISATIESSDNIVNVNDIPFEDQIELFGHIADFSGLSAKKLAEKESFREESNR